MTLSLLQDLNPPQQKAVQATEGPVLVLAGPGSGKTRVLIYRIAYLINELNVDPYSILAVTFTNKAAREMQERLENLIGIEHARALTVGTFHSLCTRFLRHDIDHLGRGHDFAIYDSDDQQRLMQRILRELSYDEKKNPPRSILYAISSAKSEMIPPHHYLKDKPNPGKRDIIVAECYVRYQHLLAESNALDFDDLLLETVRLFQEQPQVLAWYHERYTYLLVDEYQDTNQPQYHIVRHLAASKRNLFVIGDDDQSIYAWRGADVRNILEFARDYPDAQVFTLEQNYRSTQTILDVAQAIIHAESQNKKYLWTDKGGGLSVAVWEGYDPQDESQLVAEEIASLISNDGYALSDFAVMYRTNAQSRTLEEAFMTHGLRYQVVGGTRFYERKEIKDILAYLRLLVNPTDSVSLTRIINTPRRGIGERTIEQLNRHATASGVSIYHLLGMLENKSPESTQQPDAPQSTEQEPLPTFAARIQNALRSFLHLLETLRAERYQRNLVELLDHLLATLSFHHALLDEYGEAEGTERWANVEELRNVAQEYTWMPQESQLTTFLEEVTLMGDIDRLDTRADAITCITLHQSKGLEFPVVFLIGVEDGLLPHSGAMKERDKDKLKEKLAEERRLFYVGITRAQERLYLLHCFRRFSYGGEAEVRPPSRFLSRIPPELMRKRSNREHKSSRTQQEMFSARSSFHSAPQREITAQEDIRTKSDASPTSSEKRKKATTRSRSKRTHVPGVRFVPGMRVHHALYGKGTVVTSTLVEGDEEVTVHFDEEDSERRLLASFAQLEKAS